MYEKVRLSSGRFLSWLILKLQAVGTEDPVLQDSSELPKKKTTRKQDLPDGAPRYGPQTRVLCLYAKEFRKEERAKKGKRKVTATTTSANNAGPPSLASKPAKRAGKTGQKT